MKRLKWLLLVFSLALAIPLTYFIFHTYKSLEQEESAELRFFAETLFDRMENELADLVRREESRAIDEYSPNQKTGEISLSPSPLSIKPKEKYILGYFQNSPDGSLQTPLAQPEIGRQNDHAIIVDRLDSVNSKFNQKRTGISESYEAQNSTVLEEKVQDIKEGFDTRYFSSSQQKQKITLGQEAKRVEQVPMAQVLNLAKGDSTAESELRSEEDANLIVDTDESRYREMAATPAAAGGRKKSGAKDSASTLQVEVDPLQSVLIDNETAYVFRRIVINNQIYRQGFVVELASFLNHLVETYFRDQPLNRFTGLRLSVKDQNHEVSVVETGVNNVEQRYSISRKFPRPFSFLHARLTCDKIPPAPGRKTLTIMMWVLGSIILIGLYSIYQSMRVVVDLSERRAGFVSSVTHELKTPLTNIRMYIEMLEQGIAGNRDREREYFRILGSESSRLSRLINNVLEFSRLEKKQRPLEMKKGTFDEVINEANDVMREKLRQEGIVFRIEKNEVKPFRYDSEAMIQVLINLIDNSIKFSQGVIDKEIVLTVRQNSGGTQISVKDNGVGIEKNSLKKIFDDFYRADNSMTRQTKGTGIGLALVKKLVTSMGGTVAAKNNRTSGCKVTVFLPS